MSSLEPPDYPTCFDVMRRAGLPFSPSEAHAIAIGMLSGAVADRAAHWQAAVYAELAPDNAAAAECRGLLDELYALAEQQMTDDAFGLQLFLPAEACAGVNVATALRDWAQGFLYGFGLAGEAVAGLLSDEGREALHDLYEIAHLATDVDEAGEEEQQAATEIEEYMRVAAMLIHADVHARPRAGGTHELH